jgi:hypothetical protein
MFAVHGDDDHDCLAVLRSAVQKPKPLHFSPHMMADPQMLTAEGEEVLREEINKRIGGAHVQ